MIMNVLNILLIIINQNYYDLIYHVIWLWWTYIMYLSIGYLVVFALLCHMAAQLFNCWLVRHRRWRCHLKRGGPISETLQVTFFSWRSERSKFSLFPHVDTYWPFNHWYISQVEQTVCIIIQQSYQAERPFVLSQDKFTSTVMHIHVPYLPIDIAREIILSIIQYNLGFITASVPPTPPPPHHHSPPPILYHI